MLLARNFPDTKPGKILDIGSGCGILSILANIRYPYAEIHAIDIDPRAVALSELNFNRSNRISAWGSDLFDQVMDRDYDLIISNIPAKPTKEVHEQFIKQALTHLKKNGWLYIVGAGHLKTFLERILKRHFGESQVVKRSRSYTVLAAQKK